jgi:hypothetical protein
VRLTVLQRFTLLSVLVSAGLMTGMGWLVCSLLSDDLLSEEAETTAEAVRAVTDVELPPDVFTQSATDKNHELLEHMWTHFQRLEDAYRMVVYDTRGRALWSSDPRLQGRNFGRSRAVTSALRGRPAIEITQEGRTGDQMNSSGMMSLEVYVPLVATGGHDVYGVLRISKHTANSARDRRRALTVLWLGSVGGGVLLLGALLWLFRDGIKRQVRLLRLETDYARVQADIELAAAIQKNLLPARLPDIPGFSMAAWYMPSGEVSGDHYDAHALPDSAFLLVMADNEGKGVPGAMLMMRTHAAIEAHIGKGGSPCDVLRDANRTLSATSSYSSFVTLFLGKLDARTKTLEYCNAGHCPGLLVRAGEVTELEQGGLPLGIEETETYESGTLRMQPKDVLFLYTDGLTETFSPQDEIFGLDRLKETLQRAASRGAAQDVVDEVRGAVRAFRGSRERQDDVAMMCLVAHDSTAPVIPGRTP